MEFLPGYGFALFHLSIRVVREGDLLAQDGYAGLVVLLAWEALRCTLGEAGDISGFVLVDFEAPLAQCIFILVEHMSYFFGGGSGEDEVVHKEEVGEVERWEGEASVCVRPLFLNWCEEVLYG